MATNTTIPTLTEEEKYKKSDWTMGDTAKMGAAPTYFGLKTLGGGSATQGLATTAKVAGIGAKSAGKGVAGFVGNSVKSAGGVKGLVMKGYVPAGVALSSVDSYNTPTDNYYERHSWLPKPDSDDSPEMEFGKDLLARTVGVAGDTVSNVFTWGGLGDKFFKDRIRENNEALAQQAQQAQPAQAKTPTNEQTPTADTATTAKTDDGYELQKIDLPRQTSYHFDYGNKPASQQPQQPQATIPTGGIPSHNQSYTDLVKKVQEAQQQTLGKPEQNLGLRTHAPVRSWENEAQRKALLREATTPIKGARGLTANQMRLAHELSNDDIKLAQERHLQQNNLNHQLLQEQIQQQGQNARTLAGEQGANARAVMNEQGQNNRFNTGFGLDVARFNQDVANKQHEFGLRGMELNAKLKSQSYDDAVKQELNSLYHNYGLAQTDEEKQALYDKLGFLTGKGGQKANPKDYLMTVSGGESKAFGSDDIVKNPDRIIDTRTMQVVDVGQADASKFNINDPNHQAHVMELVKKETSVEGRKKLLMEQMGLSEEEAQIAIQNAMGAK